MAWVTPTSRSTGFLVTAAVWNQDVVDNTKYLKGQDTRVVFEEEIEVNGPGHGVSPPRILMKQGGSLVGLVEIASTDVFQFTKGSTSGVGLATLRALGAQGNVADLLAATSLKKNIVAASAFSTSSTTLVDVTGASITLSLPCAGMVIALVTFGIYDNDSTGILTELRTSIDGDENIAWVGNPENGVANTEYHGSSNASSPVSSGSRVVKLRMKVLNATSTATITPRLTALFIPSD